MFPGIIGIRVLWIGQMNNMVKNSKTIGKKYKYAFRNILCKMLNYFNIIYAITPSYHSLTSKLIKFIMRENILSFGSQCL